MPKVKGKERILKAVREKQLVTYRGVPIRLSANFSKETLQARRDWQEIFKVMETRDLQPRLLYSAKVPFRSEGQIKSFPDKKKTKVHHHQTIIIWNVKGTHLWKRSKLWIKWQQIHISTIESKKQTKQTRRIETESWIWRVFCWLPGGRGVWGNG